MTNPKWGTQFDVPGDWEVSGTGVISGFEDVKDPTGPPAVGFSAPAYLKTKWCSDDTDKDGKQEDTGLAGVGTKGAQGAKSTDEAATNEASNWVWAAYAQEDPKEKVKTGKPEQYTTKSGLSGSVVKATATGLANKNKCDTDGKSIAFSFKNAKGDYSSWILYANMRRRRRTPGRHHPEDPQHGTPGGGRGDHVLSLRPGSPGPSIWRGGAGAGIVPW